MPPIAIGIGLAVTAQPAPSAGGGSVPALAVRYADNTPVRYSDNTIVEYAS